MRVRVIHDFRDRTADLALRKKGEVLEVDEERAATLESLGLVERIREPKKKEPKETEELPARDTIMILKSSRNHMKWENAIK